MKLLGFDLPIGPSGHARCPICRMKEYDTLARLKQHLLWKHSKVINMVANLSGAKHA
ncbi:MAG TPA: hypothetical protein VEH56_01565 [Candidatus Saccharimonadales bacterium]|nr:hypothetical protein [Candidatus Saccharimonadales bacterium]